MTDEEKLAKEYASKQNLQNINLSGIVRCKLADAFLAGLKAGKPEWHELRKKPTDLPKDTYDVLDQAGYKVHYNFFQNVWVNEKDEIDKHVIAWCEIPTFDKE